MSDFTQRLKEIVDEPLIKIEDNNNNYQKDQSPSLNFEYSSSNFPSPPQSKEEVISEIKSKISIFKKMKSNLQHEDLLNFNISREGLKKYYANSGKISQNNLNIKQNQLNVPIEKNDEVIANRAISKSGSKPEIYHINTSSNFLGVNIKNIFKPLNQKSEIDSNRTNQTGLNPSKIKKSKSKSKREYIKLSNAKDEKNEINFNANEDQQDDKIRTQINLFVKQLNYNKAINNEMENINNNINNNNTQNSKRKLGEFRSNFTYNNINIEGDFNHWSGEYNSKCIKVQELRELKNELKSLSIEEIRNLSNDYIGEIEKLVEIMKNVVNVYKGNKNKLFI